MRKLVVVMLGVVLLFAVISGVASAQQYTNVANLTPFSAESNYMSLPGYLRYVTYQQTNLWLTYDEASRIVHQQAAE
jgi:hypothetical protein